jgi:low affinity Fe/Cu permease
MNEIFHRFAQKVSIIVGSARSFIAACLLIIFWGVSGPWFHFSDSWELIINTLTTIITFLMVFIIQNSQNRDMKSVHLKLDELIRVTKTARNGLIALENMSDEDLDKIEKEFSNMVQEKKEISKSRKDHSS